MLNWLKQRIVDVIKWFADIFIAVFKALWDLVTDLFSWIFDQLMSLVVSALSAIDLVGLNNYNPQTGFTSEMLNIMGLIGLGEASAIIVTAIGIRLILQLIPFTRLGS